MLPVPKIYLLRFSLNDQGFASEFIENLEENVFSVIYLTGSDIQPHYTIYSVSPVSIYTP